PDQCKYRKGNIRKLSDNLSNSLKRKSEKILQFPQISIIVYRTTTIISTDILLTISTVQKLLIRYGKLVNVEIHTFINNSYRYQRQDSLQYNKYGNFLGNVYILQGCHHRQLKLNDVIIGINKIAVIFIYIWITQLSFICLKFKHYGNEKQFNIVIINVLNTHIIGNKFDSLSYITTVQTRLYPIHTTWSNNNNK
ncbi:hypothetical protein AGLY_014895, partial [Aphis glycines]